MGKQVVLALSRCLIAKMINISFHGLGCAEVRKHIFNAAFCIAAINDFYERSDYGSLPFCIEILSINSCLCRR